MDDNKQMAQDSARRSAQEQTTAVTSNVGELRSLIKGDWKKPFQDVLGDKAPAFMQTVLNIVTNPDPRTRALRVCEPKSILRAALVAASTGLSIDGSTGQSAIVPYGGLATFQVMVNGWLQLALRTGMVRTINVSKVYEGDIKTNNPFTGDIVFNLDNPKRDVLCGYYGYIELLTGFRKGVYWTIDELKAHGRRYSKTFNNSNGLWNTDFNAMAEKTVIKALIKKYCPIDVYGDALRIAMQFDQSSPRSINLNDGADYPDNPANQSDIIDIPTEEVISDERA